jgi:hypothetical protein
MKRESYLVGGRAYGSWRIAESRDAHSRFLAICYEAISAFLRTRDERRFTNDGTAFLRSLLGPAVMKAFE